MSNLYRFSIAHKVFPFDLRGLQCDAGARKSERKGPSSAALGRLACRKKYLNWPRRPAGSPARLFESNVGSACAAAGPARPCRRPGRPPQAEGLPHRKPQIPGPTRPEKGVDRGWDSE
jgi:hypothetical protein